MPGPRPSQEIVLNYRHQFHAGNFADVMKHAVLLALIAAMPKRGQERAAVRVVETHAGAGLYDLEGPVARRTGEAEAGVGRLMAADTAPGALETLRALVRAENPDGRLNVYPGSPLIALGAGAGYVGCELQPDEFEALKCLLALRKDTLASVLDSLDSKRVGPVAVQADGYTVLGGLVRRSDLVLIDPPYEAGDDYDRAAEAVAMCRSRGAAAAVWAPVKDLETLDGFVRRLEALSPARLILAEVRLRPLANPMTMNGSAMLLVDTPDVTAQARAICRWVAEVCGDAGGRGGAARLV